MRAALEEIDMDHMIDEKSAPVAPTDIAKRKKAFAFLKLSLDETQKPLIKKSTTL